MIVQSALRGLVVTAAGFALAGLTLLAFPELRDAVGAAFRGDTEEVRADIRDLEGWGAALVIALALIHAFLWYPAEILDAAAGFVYGFGPALALVMAGWLASALIAYAIGRHGARPIVFSLVRERRFRRYERLVEHGGVTLLLLMRLIPIVPFSLFCYVTGAARVPVWRFMWTTAVGYLPITAIFVYFGSQLESLSVTDPLIWLSAAALVAMFLAIRLLGPRLTAE